MAIVPVPVPALPVRWSKAVVDLEPMTRYGSPADVASGNSTMFLHNPGPEPRGAAGAGALRAVARRAAPAGPAGRRGAGGDPGAQPQGVRGHRRGAARRPGGALPYAPARDRRARWQLPLRGVRAA